MLHNMVKAPPWYGGQLGVPGSDTPLGFRLLPTSLVIYVDYDHSDAHDTSDGTDPVAPKSTVASAVAALQNEKDMIIVRSMTTENVVVLNSYPDNCAIIGAGPDRHTPEWTATDTALPCLTVNAEGWNISGFTFNSPASSAAILLNDTIPLAGDSAYKTTISDCIFDGLWGGLYGIQLAGAPHRVRILNCQFLEHRQGDTTAHAIFVSSTPNASPYECEIIGNVFWENENHIAGNGAIVGFNLTVFQGNIFHEGELIAATLQLDLRGGSLGNNIVTGNIFCGDYSNAGGFYAHAGDPGNWVGNSTEDILEAEVGDNGWTISPPA